MDTLLSLRVFCTVAELKSFTAAAGRLGLSPAMASKHVMHLENRLGSRLLNRTSRHVNLTEAGVLYFNQARQMLDGLDEVEAAVSNVTVTPRGILKLSAPVWIANAFIAGGLAEYHQRYPDVVLDMDFSGRIVNLVDEGFDLALRATAPENLDPGLVARPLMDVIFQLVGSGAYLSRTGRPKRVADLEGHALLLYSGTNWDGSFPVNGSNRQDAARLRTVMRTENETMLHMAALSGMGLAFLPTWMSGLDIDAGRLEVMLPGELNFTTKLYAVYPSRKYLSAKVRTFIDFWASRSPPSIKKLEGQ